MTTRADKARGSWLCTGRANRSYCRTRGISARPGSSPLGFEALATTSSGFAATLGRNDGAVSRDEALVHAAVIVAATDLPVSADLENAFADEPTGVAETIGLAIQVGLAGASIEDFTGRDDVPIYDARLAAERVVAAADIAHAGPVPFVLTARAENYLHGRPDLAIRSPGCRPTRRPAPMSCTPRACAASRTSARSSARWTARSTCSPWTGSRPWPSWPRPA